MYEVIYADPPWRYAFSKSRSRKVENHYDTLDAYGVRSLPIEDLIGIAPEAVCYMWSTAPKLKEALDALAAWGFHYKTCAVWDKLLMGMGYWFRGQHELLLVGVKGDMSPPPPHARPRSVITQKRGRHSAKPDCVRDLIRDAFPDKKAIELFARWPGDDYWDVWGREAH